MLCANTYILYIQRFEIAFDWLYRFAVCNFNYVLFTILHSVVEGGIFITRNDIILLNSFQQKLLLFPIINFHQKLPLILICSHRTFVVELFIQFQISVLTNCSCCRCSWAHSYSKTDGGTYLKFKKIFTIPTALVDACVSTSTTEPLTLKRILFWVATGGVYTVSTRSLLPQIMVIYPYPFFVVFNRLFSWIILLMIVCAY